MGTMTYLATVTAFLTSLVAAAAIVLGLAVIAIAVPAIRSNHAARINRHESIPTYYRGVVFGH